MLSWKFLEKQAHFNKVEGKTLTFLKVRSTIDAFLIICKKTTLHKKYPKTEFFLVRIFPYTVSKYGPEKTQYLEIFAQCCYHNFCLSQ